MKVLFINSDSGNGSTGSITWGLYERCLEEGYDAKIGYGRTCRYQSKDDIRIGSFFHVYVHVLFTRCFDLQGYASTKATKKFLQKIKEYNPDVIHLHNLHGSYLNVSILFDFLRNLHKPVIWTLHDCWSYTGHCAHYAFIKCEKWKTKCHHCEQKKLYPASMLYDGSSRNYWRKKQDFCGLENLTIVVVSGWLASQVKQSFLKDYPVQEIPNGINELIFRPVVSDLRKRYGLDQKTIILGVASVWHERKGIGIFEKLAEVLESNYQIVLVGLEPRQKKRISKKILAIDFTKDSRELAQLYSCADIFLNASVEESFGLVTLEALSCGTQVITNPYTANPELVTTECGIVVEEVTIKGYIDAIYELKKHPKNEERCRNRAKEYSIQKCYDAYIRLYKERYDEINEGK